MPFNTTGQPTPQSLTPDRLKSVFADGSRGTPFTLLFGTLPLPPGRATPQSLFLDLRAKSLNGIADDSRGTPFTLLSLPLTVPGQSTPPSLLDPKLLGLIPDDTRGTPFTLIFTTLPLPIGQPTPQSLFLDFRIDSRLNGIADDSRSTPFTLLSIFLPPPIGQPTPPAWFFDSRVNLIPDDSRGVPFSLVSVPPLTPGQETPQWLTPDIRLNRTINADTSHGVPPVLVLVLSIREV